MFAKKSLGQNFLRSQSALQAMVDAGNIAASDTILEIGPGEGALTAHLLKTGAEIVCIEKDARLVPILKDKFYKEIESGQLKILEEDALKINPENLFKKYKVISNIPYYITGEIIRKFLTENLQPEKMVLMVQKEVAERIVGNKKMPSDKPNKLKESILSISVKAYSNPKYIKTVKAGSFVPAPKVDSAIISFENISKDFFIKNKIDEENFFKIVKAGFSHKRKRLFSNLKTHIDTNFTQKKCDLHKNIRAEDLSLNDWANLIINLK